MRVSTPSLRMTIAGALSTRYLALSSLSSTKFFSTIVTLSLSDAISPRICFATCPLSDPPNVCVNRTSSTGRVMDERCSLSVASSCGERRPIVNYFRFRIADCGLGSLELEEVVEGFLSAAWLIRAGVALRRRGCGGLAFPCGPHAEVLALVGDVLGGDAHRNPDGAFEA